MNTTAGARMRAEIVEQPDRWTQLAEDGDQALAEAASLLRGAEPQLLSFIARGSSDHAAQYGQYLAHNLLGIPTSLATPGTTTLYHRRISYPRTIGIAISQSGESPDLLQTVQATQRAGVRVIALTNDPDSRLAGLADHCVALQAGPEAAVAATKTYTAELLAVNVILSLAAGGDRGAVRAGVDALAEQARGLIDAEASGPGILGSFEDAERAMVVGRGYGMATAKEGALKLMETSRISASGWSATDATHGPLGQVVPGMPVIGIVSDPAARASVESFLSAAAALDARILRVDVATSNAALTPLLDILPFQWAALRTSVAKGLDPDAPIGLKKVTQTI